MGAVNHALLAPSAAFRWLNCTLSAKLEATLQSTAGEAAAEGTAAHALAEHKLRKALKQRSKRPHSEFDSDEMEDATDGYTQFVQEQIAAIGDQPTVLVEQRLDLGNWVPDSFGTADCLIIGSGVLHVIDLKFGQGVLVSAERNPQLSIYALGALDAFGFLYDITEVRLSIYQPRRENVETWVVSVSDLYSWANDTLKPKAQLASQGEGEFVAGDWCRFCRAAGKCRKRAEANLALARDEFALPPTLTDAEIEELLPKLDGLIKWAESLQAYALDAAVNHGKTWSGYKLVAGKSSRKYKDEKKVAEAAIQAGYTDIYDKKLICLTAMEKLMKKDFNKILGAFIVKPVGKPTLVPESDKRPAIKANSAEEDFTKLEDK